MDFCKSRNDCTPRDHSPPSRPIKPSHSCLSLPYSTLPALPSLTLSTNPSVSTDLASPSPLGSPAFTLFNKT
ncbi:hypothetical protein E2C01_027551 [Portunus trituberculatus]|uniref:Uncharacterized protein n=1 Tax=Portunus trituberculatus TaxID=210409 RepID=A0A5B7EI58_PORTR|nr:hypothetical protein [Portunus trituberculatus]